MEHIPKQSNYVRCSALEMLRNGLCCPLTKKFGDLTLECWQWHRVEQTTEVHYLAFKLYYLIRAIKLCNVTSTCLHA